MQGHETWDVMVKQFHILIAIKLRMIRLLEIEKEDNIR